MIDELMEQIRDFSDLHIRCRDADVVAYEPPIEWAHVWEWYARLSRTRQVGMAANPITHLEIEAFSRLYRVSMEPWEVEAIIEIDAVFRAASASKAAGSTKTESSSDGEAVKALTGRAGKKRTIVMPKAAKAN